MTEPTLDTLTRRLDRLERENRRWKLAGGLAALVVLVLAVMGQAGPRPRSVDAEEFILKDSSGKRRAVLSVAQGGLAHLAFYDRQDAPRLGLGVGGNGAPTLALADAGGHARAKLELQADGVARVILLDEKYRLAVVVGVSRQGAPWVGLSNHQSGSGAEMGVLDNGDASFSLTDSSGKIRATLGLADGSPTMMLTDEKGSPRVGVSASRGQDASIGLLDGGGKVLWKAP
jgi:hypothetical protein